MPKLTLGDSELTPIPNLSLRNDTIDFLKRIFSAHRGYRTNENVSQVLQIGGFHEAKYITPN